MDEQAVINKLLAGDEATFQQLLEAMQSHENEHRQAGEKVFNFLRDSHYDVVVKLLLNGLGSRNADVQLYSTVYLRKVLSSTHDAQRLLSGALDPGTIKTQLLGVLSRVESMTHKTIENVCYTIVQVSSLFLGEEGQPWPELLKVVEECCSVEAAGQRVFTGITLFNELIQMLPDSAGPWILSLMQPLSTFMDKGTSAIKVAAVAAATSVLLEKCDDKDVVGHYKQLIPWALKALSDLLQAGDESSAQDVMQQLISISEETEDGAGWFRDNFVETANAMLTVARQEHLEADTRKLAVEVVMAILEQKPSMIRRRFLSLVGPLFELCMVFLLDVEDDQEWYDSQDEQGEDAGEGELFGSAQEWLDRMAIKLGGKIMLHAAGPCITTWASDADWRKRHAVLICLAQIAEGCAKVMKKSYLGELAQQCVVGLTDSHPRVRWSACQAVGQLCTDLGPEFQDEQHQLLLEGGLMKAMEDFQHQRVVAHATAALVNFSDNCEREMLAVYLPAIIPKLVALLPNYDRAPPRRVQEGSLTAIASMADCSQAEFKPYYDAVMPTLIHVFENANGKKDQMLRAKALECISLVGMAVGKEQFGAQALYLMDRIQALLGVQLDPDDQLLSYMQQAGARICKCLGRDFQPYLPIVIPALMKSASRQDVEKVDPDDPRLEALQEDESYHVIPLASNTALVINTDISEEKANALNLLCCYIDELRDLFFPYLNELLPIAIDNCRENVLSFETKQAAVKLLPDLLICAMAAMQSNNHQEATLQNVTTLGQQIWQVLCGMQKYDLHIAQKTNNPGDAQLSSTVLEALDGVLEHLEPSMLPMETIQETVSLVQEVLVHVQKRRLDLSKRKDDDEVDEEEVEMIANEDEVEKEVIEQVETLLGTMLRKYREAVFPLMQPIATLFASMVQSSDPDEKRIAILFIDDVVENVPNSCQGLVDNMINILAESIAPGTDADTCQSAVYGLSVIASKREYDHAFKPKCLQVLQVMLSQQRDSENEMALDNATAALGKILMHHRDALGEHAPTVCAAWLGHLPVLADEVEGQAMHAALLDATLQRDQLVLGDNNCNVARIAEIFLQVLARSDTLLEESRQPQMVSCYMQLRGQPGVQAVEQAVLPKLSESQQSRLKQAMGM